MKWLATGFLSLLLISSSGCSLVGGDVGLGSYQGAVQVSMRGIEEKYLGVGEGPFLYRYAEDLLYQGRYREAVNAYYNCEQGAYTSRLREAARARRMWLQEVIAAYENGLTPPPPPVVALTDSGHPQVTPKPIYDGPYAQSSYETTAGAFNPLAPPPDSISVVEVDPDHYSPNTHYLRQGGAYSLYGFRQYPGDMRAAEVEIQPLPPYLDDVRWYKPWTWW